MHVGNHIYARKLATMTVFLLDSSGFWEKDVGETSWLSDGAGASLQLRDHPSMEYTPGLTIQALARIEVVDDGGMDPRCASAPMYRGTGCCLMVPIDQ